MGNILFWVNILLLELQLDKQVELYGILYTLTLNGLLTKRHSNELMIIIAGNF